MPVQTFSALLMVFCALFVFGVAYNHFVAKLEAAGDAEGNTWLLVVVGVLVTIGGIAIVDELVDWNAGVVGLLAFAASGTPMSLGALWRHRKLKRREKEAVKDLRG